MLRLYQTTANLPSEEKYGLQSQIRRASSSIPMNIAEGCGRGSNPDLSRFLRIAMGSASEVEYQLLLLDDLRMISSTHASELTTELLEIKCILNTLIQRVSAAEGTKN